MKPDLENINTKKSVKKILPAIDNINKYFSKLEQNTFITPKFRKYIKHKFTKTKYAYCSFMIINEDYLPGLLALGYSIRQNKNKYNLVCIVQDKPRTILKNNNKFTCQGISKKAINDILEIFDVVYGVDLLCINCIQSARHFTKKIKHYSNINTYVTKVQVFGLLEYDRIIYLDASTIVNKNIDKFFTEYPGNHFLFDSAVSSMGMGIHGAVFIIKPSTFFYTKALYLICFYNKIFENLFFKRGIDEVIIYFTVYPMWEKKLIKIWTRCIDKFINKDCPIYHYQIKKPFKNEKNNKEKDNDYTYRVWDKYANKFVKKYPQFYKYFSHIKQFRNVNY